MTRRYHIPVVFNISLEVELGGGYMLNEKYQILLNQYDIRTDYLKRSRGGMLCHTSQGIYALAPVSLSEERLNTVSQWTQALRDAQFTYIDQYILNKDGCFLSYDKYYEPFALRKTYAGTECDIHSLKDMRIAARNLGCFHRLSKDISFACPSLRKYASISDRYHHKYAEMKSISRYVRGKKNKGEFEYLFLEQTKDLWSEMEQALSILEINTPSYSGWCHGAYNHHNIIITESHPATIHFEHFFYGHPILDLYYFLRKVLEKNNYLFSYCETIIKNYDTEFPLSRSDKKCLYGLLLFPEKFWKISNQYMSHKKHWVSPRYINKLQEFILCKELRAVFLEKYIQFYNVF